MKKTAAGQRKKASGSVSNKSGPPVGDGANADALLKIYRQFFGLDAATAEDVRKAMVDAVNSGVAELEAVFKEKLGVKIELTDPQFGAFKDILLDDPIFAQLYPWNDPTTSW